MSVEITLTFTDEQWEFIKATYPKHAAHGDPSFTKPTEITEAVIERECLDSIKKHLYVGLRMLQQSEVLDTIKPVEACGHYPHEEEEEGN